MSPTTVPGAVVERSNRWILLVPLAAAGFIEAGLVAALIGAVREASFDVAGDSTGPGGTAVAFALLTPLALLLGVALLLLVRGLFSPSSTTVLTSEEYRREERGRVVLRIHRDQATGLVFRPGAQATWQGSDPDDPSLRGVSRHRLRNRIELRAPAATVELTDGKRWPQVVDILRGWVHARPELVDDPATISFLRDTPPPMALPPTHTPQSGAAPAPRRLPGNPIGLILLAIRRRDPWAPFLPDAYGRYSPMFNGRYTLPRAPRPGSALGLVMRWLFLAMWLAPLVIVVYLVVELAVVLAF